MRRKAAPNHAAPPASCSRPQQAKAAERQTALLDSALSERQRVCPFRPATNHARRQEALARLLGAPAQKLAE